MLALLKEASHFIDERYRGHGAPGSVLAEARSLSDRIAAVIKRAEEP
jgi:hypothetical protein